MKQNIFGITPKALECYLTENGENPAKSALIFDHVYRKGEPLHTLPFSKRIKAMLESDFSDELPAIVEAHDSDDAAKLLLKLSDGEYVETVLMRQKFGSFVCVSTQVGCSMGCAFCQSGRMKKRRNLSTAEITGQVLAIARYFKTEIKGVSVMGIGEPFDNFNAVTALCDILVAPKGLALGEKHITVSTCGIVPKIYEYAELSHPCNLAISLHAPNDELRNRLMPVNKAYPLNELIKAAEFFSVKANRRVTLEYVMLKGINDSTEHAEQLCQLIGKRDFYVNIIPYNSTDSEFEKSDFEQTMAFYDVLKKHKVGVTMRREFGAGLKAACGQLRADYTAKEEQ